MAKYITANPLQGNGKKKSYGACFETHPVLEFEVDTGSTGKKLVKIQGGSCTRTRGDEAEIFIGLDSGMTRTKRRYPWEDGEAFCYPIADRGVPQNEDSFKDMLDWVAGKLLKDVSVYVGCIGGHGRTGLFLAALVARMTGMEDTITFVRENYCKKAVESDKQVAWLVKHYGVKKVEGTDANRWGSSAKGQGKFWNENSTFSLKGGSWTEKDYVTQIAPMPVSGCIHGENTD